MKSRPIKQHCIRGTNRKTLKREVIGGPYDTRSKAQSALQVIARCFRRTHTHPRVAEYK